MNDKMRQMFQPLVPFIVLGIVVALAISLLLMFSYIVLWGILLGGIFWLVSLIKLFFFPSRQVPQSEDHIIEHDDKI